MTDYSRDQKREFGLYALAFGLALAIRLLRLGEIPLGDDEARLALQALDLAKGLPTVMGPQPAYVVLTGLAFFILQASNFAARLAPALFGAALSLAPINFRDRLGSKPALVLAFLLAIDPGFLALSRLAGGSTIAAGALLFAWGAWRKGNLRLAGILVGLALLSGAQLWPGLLALGLSWGLLRGFFATRLGDPSEKPSKGATNSVDRKAWFSLVAYAVGTYILLGSFFLMAAGGLGAGLASLPAYISGWVSPSRVPVSRLLVGLAGYEFLPVLLAIAALVRAIYRRDEVGIGLGLWLLASLVLVLANPSRQLTDLGWVLLPLLALASMELSGYLEPIKDGVWETIGMAVFTGALLTFAALNYSAIALVPMEQQAVMVRWWILFGSLGLLFVSIVMVAFGWSVATAVQGSLWGALTILTVYSLSTAMAAGGLRSNRTQELWSSGPDIDQFRTVVSQMNDLSRWKTGVNASLDVTIAGVNSPALLWGLRDWPLTVVDGESLSGKSPAVVIASEQFPKTTIQTVYRGHDFGWRVFPPWEAGIPADWLRWSILHEFPKNEEKLILWVRSDVFIDSQNNQ